MMKIISLVIAVTWSVTAPSGHAGAAMPCADADEKTALDVRALQSDLMVAALSCNMRNEYNAFVHDYADVLPDFGEDLRAYFSRVYRHNSQVKLDRFVTEMAGDASLSSLDSAPSIYCANIAAVYNALKSDDIYPEDVAVSYGNRHDIDFCTDYPQGELRALFAKLLF